MSLDSHKNAKGLPKLAKGISYLVFFMSLLGGLVSLKKAHTCYCHEIWTAIK